MDTPNATTKAIANIHPKTPAPVAPEQKQSPLDVNQGTRRVGKETSIARPARRSNQIVFIRRRRTIASSGTRGLTCRFHVREVASWFYSQLAQRTITGQSLTVRLFRSKQIKIHWRTCPERDRLLGHCFVHR